MKKEKKLDLVIIYSIIALVIWFGFMSLNNNSSGNVIEEESLIDTYSEIQIENTADNGLIDHWTFDKTLNDFIGTHNGIFKVTKEKSFFTKSKTTYKYMELEEQNPVYVKGVKNESILLQIPKISWINNAQKNEITGGNIIEFGNWHLPDTFSVSVWFNTSASNENSNNNRIIGDRGTSSRVQRGFHITTGTKQSFIVANGTANAEIILANSYNDSQWHNLIAIYNKQTGKMDLYIDGVLKKSIIKPLSGNIMGEYPLVAGGLVFYNCKEFCFNKIADNQGKMIDVSKQVNIYHAFTGTIDDLRIYNRDLSSDEAEKLYTFCSTDEICNDENTLTKDLCNNPGTPQSKCIHEPIVCQKTDAAKGIGYPDVSKCGKKEAVNDEVYCSKVDGINSLVKKYRIPTCINIDLSKIRKAYPDYKIPQNTHFFCSSQIKEELVKKCPYNKCADGKCVNPSGINCHYDFNCNDGNSNTQDTCVNKGTTESYCTNEVGESVSVTCKKTIFRNTCNGGKAIWGSPYCTANAIYKDYTWFTCNNPGKTTSYCTSQSKKVLQKKCNVLQGYRCIDGACVKTKT